MICPTCKAEGAQSTVTPGDTESTTMGWVPFYDEKGAYHAHDPNRYTTGYACSRGHRWSVAKCKKCPEPGCEYRSRLAG